MSAVLIVDDSPPDRALFRTLLTRAGFEVHELSHGRQAVAKAREVRPHAIILDVNLPDIDGHDVCRALRADPVCAGMPVLMLTVRDNEADVLAGLEAGADDYVAKDAAGPIILARVRRLVRDRQLMGVAALNEGLVQVGRLLAGIVHEIRGPLSVIRGNAELMKLTLGQGHLTEQWVEPILRNARLLQVRLEHLMATVRTGPPVLQPLEISPVVREAADLFRKGSDPRAGKLTISVELTDQLPAVLGDAGRLIQVFLNLLGNAHEAIQSARDEGRIDLRARRVEDEERTWVEIDVIDDGPGISEAHIVRIFEPFYTTKETGSGYGLYLASEIVREHGGRLTASNVDPAGASFIVRLPVAPSEPSPGDAATETPETPST